MDVPTKTTYKLEMSGREQLKPKKKPFENLRLEHMEIKCPEFNKFLHTIVGYNQRWGGRESWDEKEWYNYVNQDGLETWVVYAKGTPVGYIEMIKHAEGDVQIVTFGLLPDFIGKGIGGWMLTKAIERAWDRDANKIWLRTCSHDHPHALNNYKARGFKVIWTREGKGNPPIKSFWELVE